MSIAAYSAKLDALIAFFRTKLAAPTLPFVIGRMAPEGIALTPGRTNVDKIHQETPARVPFTGFAPSMPGVWAPGAVTLAYQWYRSHGAISGAARAAYTPGPADRGRTITVGHRFPSRLHLGLEDIGRYSQGHQRASGGAAIDHAHARGVTSITPPWKYCLADGGGTTLWHKLFSRRSRRQRLCCRTPRPS